MKKIIILTAALCFCFSLVAAEGEAETEKKDQKPYWTPENLLYGPGITFIGLLGITPLGGCGAALHMGYAGFLVAPLLIAPMILVDGLIHTATFGLLYNNRNDDDYIADVVDFFPGGEYWKKKKESKLKSKVEDAWQ